VLAGDSEPRTAERPDTGWHRGALGSSVERDSSYRMIIPGRRWGVEIGEFALIITMGRLPGELHDTVGAAATGEAEARLATASSRTTWDRGRPSARLRIVSISCLVNLTDTTTDNFCSDAMRRACQVVSAEEDIATPPCRAR
jgi:hypothetical protein